MSRSKIALKYLLKPSSSAETIAFSRVMASMGIPRSSRATRRRHGTAGETTPGCFAGIPGLNSPSQWKTLATEAASECRRLMGEVVTTPPSAATIRALDDMSDALCRVLDAAEFCRNVHIDDEWRNAASKVCIELGSFVHELNTNYSLYSALLKAIQEVEDTAVDPALMDERRSICGHRRDGDDEKRNRSNFEHASGGSRHLHAKRSLERVSSQVDRETLLVGRMLQRDFERFGVHLEGPQRDKMAALVAETQLLGFQFIQNAQDPSKCGRLEVLGDAARAVNTLPLGTQRIFRPLNTGVSGSNGSIGHGSGYGEVYGLVAPGTTSTLTTVICRAEDEALREAAWKLYNTYPRENAALMDKLTLSRLEMAQMMGFKSYSSYHLHGFSLAGIQDAVATFLEQLSSAIKPAARAEADRLQKLVSNATNKKEPHIISVNDGDPSLQPWNRQWASAIASQNGPVERSQELSRWLTLDGCIDGAALLIQRLMGVSLREETPSSGELWAPGVRKFVAEHPEGGVLGVVYLDLMARPNKFPGAAHFTLRCGREQRNGAYQIPIVAVVASFMSKGNEPFFLPDVETLLHELGHALHSLLSRTRYQHLSGTRGPHDIVEIPSHVFERFAWDPDALAMLATHGNSSSYHSVNQPPPVELLQEAARAKHHCAGLNLQSTLVMCMIDQLFHGENPPTGQDVGRAIQSILQSHSATAVGGAEIQPHLRFSHLVGYGAGYYTYLFAQCISATLWENARTEHGRCVNPGSESNITNGAPHDSERVSSQTPAWPSGHMLLRNMLQPGGSLEAREYISGLLDVESAPMSNKGSVQNASMLVDVQGGRGCYPQFHSLLHSLRIIDA